MTKIEGRIVWMDLEMTGLNAEVDRVIEAAVLITNSQLEIIAEGPEIVIHQPNHILEAMDKWNTKHHGESGLIERVTSSTIDEAMAERQILNFVEQRCEKGKAVLAGNSIHQDRRFIRRYMPNLDGFLHYRLIDVSTVKELVRRWYPDVFKSLPDKKSSHRALDDIRESIMELKHYRENAFR